MGDCEKTQPLDLIWGVRAIAQLIGRTERQTFHMLTSGALPGRKVGSRWVVSRSELEQFFRLPTPPQP